jgi:hypothetical protein
MTLPELKVSGHERDGGGEDKTTLTQSFILVLNRM